MATDQATLARGWSAHQAGNSAEAVRIGIVGRSGLKARS
jgi:hypothetical protein